MQNLLKNKKNLFKILNKFKLKKILIISGKSSFPRNMLRQFIRNDNINIYFKKNRDPEFTEFKKLRKIFLKLNPDIVMGIGGGSVLDLTKVVYVTKKIKKPNEIFIKDVLTKHPIRQKIILLPTTAGSGAEATNFSVMYFRKKKFSISYKIKKKIIILIPDLVLNNSKKIKGPSATDTLCQSIESILSINANSTSFNYAKKSLNYFLKNYKNYFQKPNSFNALNMQIASNFSGKAINISKTTGPHALSYYLSTKHNVPHGYAVSIFLTKFLKFNYNMMQNDKNLAKKFNLLFKIFNVKTITSLNNKIENIFKILYNGKKFKNILKKVDKKKLISSVNLQRLKNNPIEVKKIDLFKILNL